MVAPALAELGGCDVRQVDGHAGTMRWGGGDRLVRASVTQGVEASTAEWEGLSKASEQR